MRVLTGSIYKFLFLLLISTNLLAEAKPSYTWAVVPQFTGTVVHRDWTPVLKALEEKTGHPFTLKIYHSIPEFEKAFMKGEADIAYMNPYHAVQARAAQGYEPIIRNSKKNLTGIIVTRKDSGINTLSDLNNKDIAFPSPNAFAASLYLRALLTEKEGIKFTPVYTKTHSNAYRHTLFHKTVANGGVNRTLKRERPEVREQLRVLYKAPSTASHPIVVHKRVPRSVMKTVQEAILELSTTEAGRNKLSAILIPKPIIAIYKRDYQALEALKLDRYVGAIK